jgi:hypothetical protein
LDGGGDVGNVVREEAAGGRAALAVSRESVLNKMPVLIYFFGGEY